MITFYYTATGNSLALAKEIGGELIAIPQLADFDQLAYKADAIGIVFPIYSPSAPPVDRWIDCRDFGGTAKIDRRPAAESFLVDERCNLCGICAKVCPAGNVTVKEKVYFGAHCENCEACLHWCPENALHLKEEKSNARWQNPSVKLREIIRANWQDQKK